MNLEALCVSTPLAVGEKLRSLAGDLSRLHETDMISVKKASPAPTVEASRPSIQSWLLASPIHRLRSPYKRSRHEHRNSLEVCSSQHSTLASRRCCLCCAAAKEEVTSSSESRDEQPLPRRRIVQSMLAGSFLIQNAQSLLHPRASEAALLQFPATQLKNDYFLVRAGEGQSEADGHVFTNPVFKTSMYSGLTPKAREKIVTELIPRLRSLNACSDGCWIWPSISQRSYQTAEIMATQLGLSRSRIVPEYSFLDARGLGDYEGMKTEAAAEKVAAGDSSSADWRPPRGTDGTPHESITDVLVRGRQVLSICETQFRNSEILIVSPDSDNLSILQAAILGVDLRQHGRYAFKPGEVRPVLLSTESANYGNSTFACPNPPRCTN